MSQHEVRVIRIQEILKHPGADQLGLVYPYGPEGYCVVVRLADWKVGDLGVYVEPDYVVPYFGPFTFLGEREKDRRVRVKKLRGIYSHGLLVPAPAGAPEGADVMQFLGIKRYEPELVEDSSPRMSKPTSGWAESPPRSLHGLSKYDLENLRRNGRVLEAGEIVFVTEKIHGANARFAYRECRMWAGSRNEWKKEAESSAYWNALRANPWIEAWCRANDTCVLYGEVFGWVADLRYGRAPGEVDFLAFDVLRPDGFMDALMFHTFGADLPTQCKVPLLYAGPYDRQKLEELAEDDSSLGGGIREGVVVKPMNERRDPRIGRVALKLVSNRYMERA